MVVEEPSVNFHDAFVPGRGSSLLANGIGQVANDTRQANRRRPGPGSNS
jgi:hypothetical protein